jgi:hypothetical protein
LLHDNFCTPYRTRTYKEKVLRYVLRNTFVQMNAE